MPKRIEWIVTLSPVRDADRQCRPDTSGAGSADPAEKVASRPKHEERIAELHRQVRAGVYDTVATLDAVARRILESGDL